MKPHSRNTWGHLTRNITPSAFAANLVSNLSRRAVMLQPVVLPMLAMLVPAAIAEEASTVALTSQVGEQCSVFSHELAAHHLTCKLPHNILGDCLNTPSFDSFRHYNLAGLCSITFVRFNTRGSVERMCWCSNALEAFERAQ